MIQHHSYPLQLLFYTLTNLQGSQTLNQKLSLYFSFTLLQTYKVLKQYAGKYGAKGGFTLLQTYKVLKPITPHPPHNLCFTLLQTYKVLKQ